MQEDLTGAVFHPLDDNLMITHGKGHLTFWNRRKDGFFERTDIIKPVRRYFNFEKAFTYTYIDLCFGSQPARTMITALQFEQDGDVITADTDGFITVYSVDSDGAYFVKMEYEVSLKEHHIQCYAPNVDRSLHKCFHLFQAHNKGVSALVMLSEGTLLSGGEKDRKICAWDSLQNYKKITESKVIFFDNHYYYSYSRIHCFITPSAHRAPRMSCFIDDRLITFHSTILSVL